MNTRIGSGDAGFSTCTTSAPQLARMAAADGQNAHIVTSMTRIPCNGFIAVPFLSHRVWSSLADQYHCAALRPVRVGDHGHLGVRHLPVPAVAAQLRHCLGKEGE